MTPVSASFSDAVHVVFVFTSASTFFDLAEPEIAQTSSRLNVSVVLVEGSRVEVWDPQRREAFRDHIGAARFHEKPLRHRLGAVLQAWRLLAAFSRLPAPRLVVFEDTARFPNRVLAEHLRCRGSAIGLLGTLAGDYSHPRWSESPRVMDLIKRLIDEAGPRRLLRLPTRGAAWALCQALDRLAPAIARAIVWSVGSRQGAAVVCGGLSPFRNPLGPVRPDVFFSASYRVSEEMCRFYDGKIEALEFRNSPWSGSGNSENVADCSGLLVILPRSTSAVSVRRREDYFREVLAAIEGLQETATLRFHPHEESDYCRWMRDAITNAGYEVAISKERLWRDAATAQSIIAFGRSSASEFVARSFPAKCRWIDAPDDWFIFMNKYPERPAFVDALQNFLAR